MANRYHLPVGTNWTTAVTSCWSTAAPVQYTGSISGTTMTVPSGTGPVIGHTVVNNVGVGLGTIVSQLTSTTWQMSSSNTISSQVLTAALVGASAPTAADDVFFGSASIGTFTVTISGGALCRNITVSVANYSFNATSGGLTISGSMSLTAGNTYSMGVNTTTFNATTTGQTITTSGVSIGGFVTFNGVGGGWTLGSALTTTQSITVTAGSFNTGNFNVTTTFFNSSNTNTRSISLGTSTIAISGSLATALNLVTTTGLTWNAGTSQINLTGSTSGIASGGLTFDKVTFGLANFGSITITGANTFTTSLVFTARSASGVGPITFSANQTIGTLTLPAPTAPTNRNFIVSDVIGTQRTLSVGTFTAGSTDYDFRDIAVTGAASPISGTRFGDCKSSGGTSNSGISFPAAKTVYYRAAAGGNWNANAWAPALTFTASCAGTTLTTVGSPALVPGITIFSSGSVSLGTIVSGSVNTWVVSIGGTYASQTMSANYPGSASTASFPLPQDTAVFPVATYPATGSTVTLSANYNLGTVDMSLRTTNTMVLATGIQTLGIYGNWINGTGISFTGTGVLTFAGRGAQTITSAGVSFPQPFTINTPGGSVTLASNFSCSNTGLFTLTAGTFNSANFDFVLSNGSSGFSSANSNTRTIAIGSSTWSLAGSGGAFFAWDTSTSTNLTVTGTGTISMLSVSTRVFAGGGIQTFPTLNQGSTGTLQIQGSNKFVSMTNTAIGTVQFEGGTLNEFTSFDLNGVSGNLLTLGSTSATQAILKKPTVWNVGANSVDNGNNTGLIFTAGGGIDYLRVSYINGVSTAGYNAGGNFLVFFP